MLELGIYSVFDSKADTFGQPWFAPNDAVARRMFSDGVADRETPISRHPEDYTLFRVGSWDSLHGKVTGMEPVAIVNGVHLKGESDAN